MGLSPRTAAQRARLLMQERRRRGELWSAMQAALQPPPAGAFASWGERSLIVPPARIDNPQFMHVGSRVLVHELSWLIAHQTDPQRVPRLSIGDDALLQRFIKIVCTGEVTLGNGVMIGDHTYIADTLYRHDDPDRPIHEQGLDEPQPVHIADHVLLGHAVIVMPGVTIGEHASIGAGTVVVEDVPPRGVVVGNPGRLVRVFDEAAQEWRRAD